ncbi:MAG: hypothetical protein K5905_03065 [Roseibium sp.]|uniref:hypothetical protein n=1 Tax=Roseibium sp. TaxID=1936156 RepID=UPI00262D9329|nr:hypothetical protein [Roseibium sp.]MCV0424429.1 hypothetical protein [Roseibium sp.]
MADGEVAAGFQLFSALTAIATPLVAICVAWVAYQQWRTAQQRIVLDLFRDRLNVFDKVSRAVRLIERDWQQKGGEPLSLLLTARDEARFLFGSEVSTYILNLILAAEDLEHACKKLDENDESEDWEKLKDYSIRYFVTEELARVFEPYMDMRQRLHGADAIPVESYYDKKRSEFR